MVHALKARSRQILEPAVRALVRAQVSPNAITIVGVLVAACAGLIVARGSLRWGGACLLASGLFDVLDGGVARATGRESPRGAFLDSTLDRYAEGVFLGGLSWYGHGVAGSPSIALAAFVILLGSLLVSYARARAEGLGTTCKVGLMERPERFAGMILICFIGPGSVLPVLLWVYAALIHATALHRLLHVYRKLS